MRDYNPKELAHIKQKIEWTFKASPRQLSLEQPVDLNWLESFERDEHICLPREYRETILHLANGGSLPAALDRYYWQPLQNIGKRFVVLDVPYPPAEDPEGLRGRTVAVQEAEKLPGQLLLMGDGRLGWSLITAGPCAGEVWTVGCFGAVRAPGCSFFQWLELMLDGNMEACLVYCFTGEEGRLARAREDLMELLGDGMIHELTDDPSEKCARWLEMNRFLYVGASGWGGYLKNEMSLTLGLLPQERDSGLAARRRAQQEPGWKWDTERAKQWERVGHLVQNIQQAEQTAEEGGLSAKEGQDMAQAGLMPGEEELFQQAVELVHGKRFQARGEGIRDLSFLEGLTRLKELDLWDNDIADLSPIASLSGLRELILPYNLISDLSPLAGMDKLVKLEVYGNRISSLEPLRGLTSLNLLDLRGNPLEAGTLGCLRKCKRLGMLNLSNTGLKDLSGLEFCRAWCLDIYENPDLTGLEVLSTMKRLDSLCLDTKVARRYDIPALAPQLTEHVEMGGFSHYVWPEKYFN